MKRAPIERAAAIARQNGGVLSVRALRKAKAGIVVTGSEVFNGLIQDRFAPILTEKVTTLGSEVAGVTFAPDDADLIRQAIVSHLENGCDLILLSGGMSVDPDDVTRQAIRQAGATEMHYGASALPGAMFLSARIGDVPLLGVPACGLYHRTTVLDLVLPRILTGERNGVKHSHASGLHEQSSFKNPFSVRIGAKRSWIRPLKTSLPVTTMPALALRSARTDRTPPF